MNAHPVIEVEHLTKRYRKANAVAVDDVSFSVEAGEFFTFLGPNGAGKTTTISILTTTLAKTSGMVRVAGFDVDHEANKVRREIGVIFQSPSLDKNLTAEENIRFHAMLYGLYPFRPAYSLMPKEYKTHVSKLAEILGIEKEVFHPIKTFSGGMKRKLEIIRSLVHHPKILFLDEPTTGLDPASRRNLWHYIKDVREKKSTTIFLTTHYLEEAEGADTVCIINHGRIVSQGRPSEIKQNLIDEYLLLDADDRYQLTQELVALNLAPSGNAPFKVALKKGESPQEIIRQIKIPLTTLKIHAPTLEEAYLEIIEDNERNEKNGSL